MDEEIRSEIMKRALLIILLIGFFEPNDAISQGNSVDQKISFVGYGLIKESNELRLIKADLIKAQKKLANLGALDDLKNCYLARLIENISLVEIICKYEGTILGTLLYIEENQRLGQYKVHENRLKDFTLKSLYLHYKATQPVNVNLEDRVVLDLTDKAKKELVAVTALIEEVIEIFKSESK
jgi:hypothetical protein